MKPKLTWRGERALVVSARPEVRQDLAVLLSGYGYTVDEAPNRRQGIDRFLTYRHAAVFMDAEFLPRHPGRLKKMYAYAHRMPLSFILATPENRERAYPFLRDAAWGLLPQPIDPDHFTYTFERAAEYARLRSTQGFVKDLLTVIGLAAPIAALLIVTVTGR